MNNPWNIIPITPVSKPRMTQRDAWKQRPCVMRYRQYKDDLRPIIAALPACFEIAFALPMPPSWSKKKQSAMVGTPHQQTPDFDNLLKGFTDAILDQDCTIWAGTYLKVWRHRGAILWRPYDASEHLASVNNALDLYGSYPPGGCSQFWAIC